MVIYIVYLVIILLIFTKLLDVFTTLQRIRHVTNESNPFARKMMYRWGAKKTVWIVFAIALVIIGVAGTAAIIGGILFQILFVAVGCGISIVQFAVVHCNWTGKDNLITKYIRRFHSTVQRIIFRN